MYTTINVESSYAKNDLGKTLYDLVLEKRPTVIVEFGCLYGYSTIAMAMALRDLGQGKLISYDIWDKYAYKHTTQSVAMDNIHSYGLSEFVEFRDLDFWTWLDDNSDEFDLLHLDISNDGDTIARAYQSLKRRIDLGASLIFEGGSVERDNEAWMLNYNKTPINSIKPSVNYRVVNESWPSLSIISND